MYYSGAGKIYGAKRDVKGNYGAVFFCGNAPQFKVDFNTGDIEIAFEEMFRETLEIICGSASQPATVAGFSSLAPDDFKHKYPEAEVLEFEMGQSAPFEYGLFFEGFNTAGNYIEMGRASYDAHIESSAPDGTHPTRRLKRHFSSMIRVELFRVFTQSASSITLIGDDIICMAVKAHAEFDEIRRKRGRIYMLQMPRTFSQVVTDA